MQPPSTYAVASPDTCMLFLGRSFPGEALAEWCCTFASYYAIVLNDEILCSYNVLT